MKQLPNIHPGEVLREEFLDPMGITQYRLATDAGLPHSRVTAIIKGRRRVTAETALRLGRYLKTGPEFWLNLQTRFDLEEAQRTMGRQIEREIAVA